MSHWIGYARAGHEFEVRDAITETGATAWVAREFATTRPPTKRRHVAIVRPVKDWGRRLVIDCTDDEWHAIQKVKHLSASMYRVAPTWVERAAEDVKLRDGHWTRDAEGNRLWVDAPVWVRKGEFLRADGLGAFMERIDRDFADREARFLAGEKLAAYQPGDAIRILSGALKGHLAEFERIVEGASDIEDKLRARLTLLGGPVVVTLDPLHVAKEAAE